MKEKVFVQVSLAPLAVPVEVAASLVGLEPATLNDMRNRGGGPAFKRLGRQGGKVVYAIPDLQAWIDSHPSFISTTAADMAKEASK